MDGWRRRSIPLIKKTISIVLIIQLAIPPHFVRAMDSDDEEQKVRPPSPYFLNDPRLPSAAAAPARAPSAASSAFSSSRQTEFPLFRPPAVFPRPSTAPSSVGEKEGSARMLASTEEHKDDDTYHLPLLNTQFTESPQHQPPSSLAQAATSVSRGESEIGNPFAPAFPCAPPLSVRDEDSDPDLFAFLHPFPADPFAQTILEVTGAEPDVPQQALYTIFHALAKAADVRDNEQAQALRDILLSLKIYALKDPEDLVDHDRITRYPASFDEKDTAFTRLNDTLGRLEDAQRYFATQLSSPPINAACIAQTLTKVTLFYTTYRTDVMRAVEEIKRSDQRSDLPNYKTHTRYLQDLLAPKALLMGEHLGSFGFYRLSQSLARHMVGMDSQGLRPLKPGGQNHPVSSLPPHQEEARVYFKSDGHPSLKPGKEAMVQSLYRLLDIPLPQTRLLFLDRLHVGHRQDDVPFVLQASQAIAGIPGGTVLKQGIPHLDPHLYAKQTLGALLTNPTDGKPDNFIYDEGTKSFVSVDNDEVFAPLFKLTRGSTAPRIETKSMLYLLPHMDTPLPNEDRQHIYRLVPELIILKWLDALTHINKAYKNLEDRLAFQYEHRTPARAAGEVKHVFHNPDHGLSLPITLVSHEIEELVQKIELIKRACRSMRHPTPQDLLEAVNPPLGTYYKALRVQYPHPQHAIRKLYHVECKDDVEAGNKGEDISNVFSLVPSESLFGDGSTAKEHTEAQLQRISPAASLTPLHIWQEFLKNLQEAEEKSVQGENKPLPLLDKVVEAHRRLNRSPSSRDGCPVEEAREVSHILADLSYLSRHGFLRTQKTKDMFELWDQRRVFLQAHGRQGSHDLRSAEKCPSVDLWDRVFESFCKENPELEWAMTVGKICSLGGPPSLAQIKGAIRGRRELMPALTQRLFDNQGTFQRDSSLTGRGEVTSYPKVNPVLYFKKNPELAGFEYAATSFLRKFGVQGVPFSEVFSFYDPTIKNTYPVLVSQAIPGETVHKIWHNDKLFDHLDPPHTYLLILASMLLNPEDAKEDNFILSADGKHLIPIDNDHAFLPGALRQGQKVEAFKIYSHLQAKSLVFCLPHMKHPLPETVRERMREIDIDTFLKEWTDDLIRVNNAYEGLFTDDQIGTFWDTHGSSTRMPFSQIALHNLYIKFHRMQSWILENPQISPLALLKDLEPYVGKRYAEGFNPKNQS